MVATSLKAFVANDTPQSDSAEMFELADGSYQVVLRLMPAEDEWEPGSYPPHKIDIRNYTNRKEAEFWFSRLAGMQQQSAEYNVTRTYLEWLSETLLVFVPGVPSALRRRKRICRS